MLVLGNTLTEQVRFNGKEKPGLNHESYEILQFSWLLRIGAVVIDANDVDPHGGAAIVTVRAVVADAIYDAIGVRLFRLPMTPARISESQEKQPYFASARSTLFSRSKISYGLLMKSSAPYFLHSSAWAISP